MPEDLAVIRKKSIVSWKSLVKKKAREFELGNMIPKKETKNKSKIKELNYEKLCSDLGPEWLRLMVIINDMFL